MIFPKYFKQFVLLCAGLLMPLVAVGASFSDVPTYSKYFAAASSLSDANIVQGYADGSFRPDQPISRAEAAKLLITAIKPKGFVEKATRNLNNSPFADVPLYEWFGPYVALTAQYGITHGYPDGTFKPHNTINLAEALKIILGAYGVNVSSERLPQSPLVSIQNSEWYAPYFAYAYHKNLISSDKFYHPNQLMSRGEFAEILYRLKTIREKNLNTFPITTPPYSNEYTLTIPRLNLFNVSVSFADPYNAQDALSVLRDGLGHYLNPPGSGKKMVLFGHSSGYNWDSSSFKQILRQIDQLEVGDRIYVNYQEKGYVYQIFNKEIMPANLLADVMQDYGYEEMALYTCWPPDHISHRYVVYAGRL